MTATPATQRKKLLGLLGDLPASDRKIGCKKIKVTHSSGCEIESLVLNLNGIEPVPAYFIKPTNAKGKLPAVLYCHSHGGFYDLGKDELFQGAPYLQKPAYGPELVKQGFAVLCIDNWAFGERNTSSESDIFKHMLWHGKVMWGMMVYDNLQALRYLRSRTDVDADSVATLGMSMGSTMAWWVAALDRQVAVCVDICCLSDYDELIRTHELKAHSVYYFVPSLLKHFSAGDINALIAPRPHLSIAGIKDPLTPARGLDKIDHQLKKAYARLRASKNWQLARYNVAHQETVDGRRRVMRFLSDYLKGPAQ